LLVALDQATSPVLLLFDTADLKDAKALLDELGN